MNITGIGFSASSTVAIDGRLCTDPVALNFNLLRCIVPDSNVTNRTSVPVIVTSDQFTAVAPFSFTYDTTDVPSILSYHPTVFAVSGGLLNLTGVNFGLTLARVVVGTTHAAVRHTSPTQIEATLPSLAPGFYSISVLTSNGYARPRLIVEYRLSVQSFSPQTGSLYGGTDVYVRGDGFDATTTVSFVEDATSIPCSIVAYRSTEIHCQTESAAPTVTISATGVHPVHGAGFAWSPAYAVVEQGATVRWEWGSSSLLNGLNYRVQQIPDGFDSGDATSQGRFDRMQVSLIQPKTLDFRIVHLPIPNDWDLRVRIA